MILTACWIISVLFMKIDSSGVQKTSFAIACRFNLMILRHPLFNTFQAQYNSFLPIPG